MLENNQRYYGLWCCHFYLTANESHTMLTLQSITSKSPQTTLLKFYTSIYSIFKPPSGKIYIKSVFPLIPSSCYSVVKSCPTLCDPMDCSTPGFPVLQYLLEFAQTHVHWVSSVQFSSAAQSCPTLCNPMNRSMPGFPVHYQLPKSTQTHVNLVDDAIQPSHPVIPFSSRPQSFPASGSFPMSQLFSSGGQSIGVSALTSVPPMNTQDWSPLGWIGWISLQSKGLSRVFSNTTLSQWYYLTISSSATLFSFCLQSFPASGWWHVVIVFKKFFCIWGYLIFIDLTCGEKCVLGNKFRKYSILLKYCTTFTMIKSLKIPAANKLFNLSLLVFPKLMWPQNNLTQDLLNIPWYIYSDNCKSK